MGLTCTLLREKCHLHLEVSKTQNIMLGNTGLRPPKKDEGNDIAFISLHNPKSMPFVTESATLAVWIWHFWGSLISCSPTPAILPLLPSVQCDSSKLASKAFWELCQILAHVTFAVSPSPSRNELIRRVPIPSSLKYKLQHESRLDWM